MNDELAHRTLVSLQRYFYRTSRSRLCKCGCGRRVSLENYWRHPTVYKKVPEFLPGHNRRGYPQTTDHVARRAEAIRKTWKQKRNPYNSKNQPRQYTAWYHQHHPGYFARKSKEWLDRQPEERRVALFARRNKRNRFYVAAYSKLYRRLHRLVSRPPSFTLKEKDAIDASQYLTEMYQKVKVKL